MNAPVGHAGATGSPETALHWAASSDDVAVLDALLDHGADIEAPGAVFTGGTPMSDAVVFAQWRAARRLLARGAATTLWQAAALGALDRVRAHVAGPPVPTAAECDNALWHACTSTATSSAPWGTCPGQSATTCNRVRETPRPSTRRAAASPGVAANCSRSAATSPPRIARITATAGASATGRITRPPPLAESTRE